MFCTAHRPDRRPAPQPALVPAPPRRTARKTSTRRPAPGQVYTDWASI